MRNLSGLILALVVSAFALPAANVPPDTVVAKVNGKPLTAADVQRILTGAPANMREQLSENPKGFVKQYALVSFLAAKGEEAGLADKTPYKEQLTWNREQVLLQAAIADKYRQAKQSGATGADLQTKTREWMDSIKADSTAEFVNDDYFSDDLAVAGKVPSDTVVAKVNGEPVTAGEMRRILLGAPSKVRQQFRSDRREFFRQLAMMRRLVAIAEKEKLLEKSPYKEQFAWVRMNILSQAALNDYSDGISISRQDEQDYYASHQDKYTTAKVKVIYIPFSSGDSAGKKTDGKKVLSEEEAKAKIEAVRKELDAGADFVELVKKYSEDETSRAKDGDFGSIRRSDKIPEHIRDAIFSLKAGEVSQPVRQPNGFYLFRADEIGVQTLDEVRQTLRPEAKGAKFDAWVRSLQKDMKVTFENEEFFSGKAQ